MVEYRSGSKLNDNKKLKIITMIPLVFYVTLIYISIFTGWIFYINDNTRYMLGDYFFIWVITCYGYFLYAAFKSIQLFILVKAENQDITKYAIGYI